MHFLPVMFDSIGFEGVKVKCASKQKDNFADFNTSVALARALRSMLSCCATSNSKKRADCHSFGHVGILLHFDRFSV